MSIFDKYDLLQNQLIIKQSARAEDAVVQVPGMGS